MEANRIWLFVHVILEVKDRKSSLQQVLRVVFFAWLKKVMNEKGVRILHIGGGVDHVHLLLQVHPAQNLMQMVKQIKEESLAFIGNGSLVNGPFGWQEEYTAFSVSPGAFKQTVDYIERQEEYHQTKTLEQELDLISKTRIDIDDAH